MVRHMAASAVLLVSVSTAWAQSQGPAAKPAAPVDAQPAPPAPVPAPPAPVPAPAPLAPAPAADPLAPAPSTDPLAPPAPLPPTAAGPPAQPTASPAPAPPAAFAPGPTSAAAPIGSGLTAEVALGIGLLRVERGGGKSNYGASAVGLGIGLWITPRDAVSLRIAGGSHREDGTLVVTASMLSVALQHWFSPTWWIGGSVGSGTLVYDYLDNRTDPDPKNGLGLELRAGYRFGVWGKHALSMSLDGSTMFVEGTTAAVAGLVLAYQYL